MILRIEASATGQVNMARDLEMLSRVESASRPLTLIRLYSWDAPTISLGRNQRPEAAIDVETCRQAGVGWVHRPTGGRAVLHDGDVTYCLVSNDRSVFPPVGIQGSYAVIAQALQTGLLSLGVKTRLARRERPLSPAATAQGRVSPCFAAAGRHELLVGSRKIAGSAQLRRRAAFLQHGSIPLSLDYERMAALLGESQQRLRRAIISVRQAAGREITWAELAEALALGFRRTLPGVRLWRSREGVVERPSLIADRRGDVV